MARRPFLFLGLTLGCSVPFYSLNTLDIPVPFGLPPSVVMILVPAAVAGVLTAREGDRLVSSLLDVHLHPLILTAPLAHLLALGLVPAADPWPVGPAQGALIIGVFVLGAIPEELGWTSYATAPLQERYGVTLAGLLIGAVWALWHVVPWLSMGRSWRWIAWQCAMTVSMRVIMGHLFVATSAELVPAVLFHGLPTHPFESERGINIRAMVVQDDGEGLRELLEQTARGELPVRIDTTHDITDDAIARAWSASVERGRRGRQVLVWV